MSEKVFSVYIVTNKTKTVLYIGVTSDLKRRIEEHRQGLIDGFTKKYRCTSLIYYETVEESYSAIEREKQLKGWTRKKKEVLIHSMNPEWKDLYETLW